MKRFTFNTSGISCKNPVNKFRLLSKYKSMLSFGCELTERIDEGFVMFFSNSSQKWNNILQNIVFQITATWLYKSGINWRQLLKTTFEGCQFLKSTNKVPFFVSMMEHYRSIFPDLPKSCPVHPKPFYVLNYTYENYQGRQIEQGLTDIPLPNGLYRTSITGSTKKDPMLFHIQYVIEKTDSLMGNEGF